MTDENQVKKSIASVPVELIHQMPGREETPTQSGMHMMLEISRLLGGIAECKRRQECLSQKCHGISNRVLPVSYRCFLIHCTAVLAWQFATANHGSLPPEKHPDMSHKKSRSDQYTLRGLFQRSDNPVLWKRICHFIVVELCMGSKLEAVLDVKLHMLARNWRQKYSFGVWDHGQLVPKNVDLVKRGLYNPFVKSIEIFCPKFPNDMTSHSLIAMTDEGRSHCLLDMSEEGRPEKKQK